MRKIFPAATAATVLAMTAAGCSMPGAPATKASIDYPRKTIRLTVPYAAGGPSDLAGRVIGECLSTELGEKVVVENKAGGAGAIGTLAVTRSAPDGYSLGIGTTGSVVIAPKLTENAGYVTADLRPISKIYELDSAILVRPDSPYTSGGEILEAMKANPGEVSVAVGGASTEYALELRRMESVYGVKPKAVPFEGGAPAQNALLGGNVDALFAATNNQVLEMIENGELRALATGGKDRSDALPEVPTLAELGYPELTNTATFFSLVAPAGLDEEVEKVLMERTHSCLQNEDVIKRLGSQFIPEDPDSPDDIVKEYEENATQLEKILG